MDEIYIKAKSDELLGLIKFDITLRQTSSEGDIMLNTTDIDPLEGETVSEKIEKINGIALTTAEAKSELAKNIWKYEYNKRSDNDNISQTGRYGINQSGSI